MKLGVFINGLEQGGFRDHLLINTAGTSEWNTRVQELENVEVARKNTKPTPVDFFVVTYGMNKVNVIRQGFRKAATREAPPPACLQSDGLHAKMRLRLLSSCSDTLIVPWCSTAWMKRVKKNLHIIVDVQVRWRHACSKLRGCFHRHVAGQMKSIRVNTTSAPSKASTCLSADIEVVC